MSAKSGRWERLFAALQTQIDAVAELVEYVLWCVAPPRRSAHERVISAVVAAGAEVRELRGEVNQLREQLTPTVVPDVYVVDTRSAFTVSAEQQARDMLDRLEVEDAQSYSAGDLVELANLIADAERMRRQLAAIREQCVGFTPDPGVVDEILAILDGRPVGQ